MNPTLSAQRPRRGAGRLGGVYLVLIAVVIVATLVVAATGRSFFSTGNLIALMSSIAVLGFVSIGQTLVILVGSLDLSVAYLVSLASVLAAGTMAGASGSTGRGVLVALLVTTAVGVLIGVLVAQVGMSGFVASLGVGLIIGGYLASFYRGAAGKASPEFMSFGTATIARIPLTTILTLLCLAMVGILVTRTRLGMHLMAVGGNAAIARASGIRTATPIVAAHALSGLFAGMGGLVIVARLGVGSPVFGAQGGYDLLSIAAVVLGGTSLAGGRGSVGGTLGGILVFAVLDSTLGILQVNPFLKDVARGAIIVLAVALYSRRSVRRRTVTAAKAVA